MQFEQLLLSKSWARMALPDYINDGSRLALWSWRMFMQCPYGAFPSAPLAARNGSFSSHFLEQVHDEVLFLGSTQGVRDLPMMNLRPQLLRFVRQCLTNVRVEAVKLTALPQVRS